MKQLPDYLLNDLIRHLQVLISINVDTKNTRVVNAIRLVKKDLKRLEQIKKQ